MMGDKIKMSFFLYWLKIYLIFLFILASDIKMFGGAGLCQGVNLEFLKAKL